MSPVGVSRDCHLLSPSKTPAYWVVNISEFIEESIVLCTSSGVGQMSLRNTAFPEESSPRESFSKSKSMVPASA